MAQDPYGYPTAAPTGNASVALWAAFGALMLALIGPCSCHMTSLLAIPIGVYAAWSGLGAREGGSPESREMALAGMLGGGLATLWSLLWVALIALYLGIYVFVIVAMIAGGNNF